jgi:hypothetical protein
MEWSKDTRTADEVKQLLLWVCSLVSIFMVLIDIFRTHIGRSHGGETALQTSETRKYAAPIILSSCCVFSGHFLLYIITYSMGANISIQSSLSGHSLNDRTQGMESQLAASEIPGTYPIHTWRTCELSKAGVWGRIWCKVFTTAVRRVIGWSWRRPVLLQRSASASALRIYFSIPYVHVIVHSIWIDW